MPNENEESLLNLLEMRRKAHIRHARNNYRASFMLYLAAIGASFIATLSVAATLFQREILAIITAIPAGVILLNSVMKLEEKSRWYYKYHHELNKLYHQLKFEGKTIEEVSKATTDLGSTMQEEYPAFGVSGLSKGTK